MQQASTSRSVFVIHDLVAESFIGQPVLDRHPAPVCRLFHSLLADPQTSISKHPADYNLVHVGFIEDNGQLVPIVPLIIATGSAWLASQTPKLESSASA